MNVSETYVSPDNALKLVVVEDSGGNMTVGFEGGNWHTHPDLIRDWLPVGNRDAVQFLVEAIIGDQLPILFKASSGSSSNAWISDNLWQTLRCSDDGEWSFRFWSGTVINTEQALEAYARIVRRS
ncbi:MAG: hypothetical protein AAF495_28325 [Pseudomonadota bacterium]